MEIALLVLYGLCLVFILGFSLSQFHLTRLARRAYRRPPAPAPAAPAHWPLVTVQLPIYNERYVVERVIDAMAALDYPTDRLHIQVLDDSTDETVALAAARIAHHRQRGLRLDHVRRPSREGYKAGALAHGLLHTNGEFIAIFDADFVPAPDFLRRTIPHFSAPDVGVVQTRWTHLNQPDSLLTELQAFGLNAHFLVEQVGRTAGGHFINFNGTGGVWRRTCIEQAGGWHADTLTEDLDLSYRAQLRGWRFVYLPLVAAPAELPAAMDALRSQQFRWNKGGAETARKHLGRVLRSGLALSTKVHATFHLLNSTVFIAILLMAVLSVPLVFVRERLPGFKLVFQLASVFLLALAPLIYYYFTAWRLAEPARPWPAFVPKFLLFLAMSMGLSLHNALAVAAGLAGRKSAFIRTPKMGLVRPAGRWQRRYRTQGLDVRTVLEGVLTLYFLFGLGAGIHFGNLGLLPLHLLLTVGFGLVFYYSVRHNRLAA
ncbi:Glycosyltransferase, catalytic subunit of cellulose synthase and poly-beta-1,6-N-acetylglucosamine synthase [Hymenobacter daecheongensis DSM 21074]|uniref:Glycosyltransferase, catalytic subunit of cellulose synthase and poly-beta-1,6-N-acetylglucosamine synthase n=1 Tax=Hymenobacter daecheongensis DSM 21074 TaxID=1121955 RepID=A0A1M6E959_9BACT|nr:cellulose synthase family protein [Hymenobacter daecheongensis]SHI81953.1 Glycosyltransferase, catalytic subunit of cellulose synthase and poly-beta-1,6-N-acetylglucosamine synthase [Hymenobacter daecheongensis DSM 21074]